MNSSRKQKKIDAATKNKDENDPDYVNNGNVPKFITQFGLPPKTFSWIPECTVIYKLLEQAEIHTPSCP
jgi:hypothetical protein